jgi:predicted nucleic acid-binding Zn ribbon protein
MTYLYKCENENCKNVDVIIEINKSITESSKEETCEWCAEKLKRVYTSPGVKTSDGFKS